jgi:hypothetical protein
MIDTFSGYGCDRHAGIAIGQRLALSGLSLADSDMRLFGCAGFATVAITANTLAPAAAHSIPRNFTSFSNSLFKL